jgi:hypothetical protein
MSRWSDLFTAPPNTRDSGDNGDNGAVGHPTVPNVTIVTPPLATERDVSSLEATVTKVPIVNAPASIAEESEEIAEFAGDATEGSIVGSLTDSVPGHWVRESEPVTMATMVTMADGEEGLPRPNPDRCMNVGAPRARVGLGAALMRLRASRPVSPPRSCVLQQTGAFMPT